MREFFSFTIADEFFALPLCSIETVVRSVELVRLPDAAPELLGLLDLRGTMVPVISIHARLHLPSSPSIVDQRIVVASTEGRRVAFFADSVESVQTIEEEALIDSEAIYPGMDHYVKAIIWQGERKILYCDPDQFLSVDVSCLTSPIALDNGD